MRPSIIRAAFATLATLASTLAIGASANAGTFGGQSFSDGIIRCATTASQFSDGAVVATNWLEIDHCSGWTEYVPIVQTSPVQFEAVGTFARLDGYVATSTNTTMKFTVHTPGDDVAGFRIVGSPNTNCGFDKKAPSPGTPGSGLGYSVTPISMIGPWTVYAHLTDAVALCPAAPQRDLYMTLIMRFSTCFRYGEYFSWKVDTDKVS